MNFIRIDKASGCDYTGVTFNNGSKIETIPSDNNIRGLRSRILLVVDKEYDKYLKRINNRNKLYNKLKKLGRRL
ncbi:hypothetical protein [Clostridium botulinum]|uniref:hypothetical protein n=1 Tax=Clostridium botulinum TaxID=1491 RepID=UPI001C9A5FBD|nr:hypothetical protein [Clostridium botulinum]MBY6838739.1 hypothetical protein [Clostridium botulinum]